MYVKSIEIVLNYVVKFRKLRDYKRKKIKFNYFCVYLY